MPSGPWLIIERAEQEYIQSWFDTGEPVLVEYRDGGPERHFAATTTHRTQPQKVLWKWTINQQGWSDTLTWQPIEVWRLPGAGQARHQHLVDQRANRLHRRRPPGDEKAEQ